MPATRHPSQKPVTVWIDEALLVAMHEALPRLRSPGRSQFIRDAIAEQLRAMGVEVPEAIALPPDRARLYPTRPAKADVRLNEPPPGPKRKPRAPSSRRK